MIIYVKKLHKPTTVLGARKLTGIIDSSSVPFHFKAWNFFNLSFKLLWELTIFTKNDRCDKAFVELKEFLSKTILFPFQNNTNNSINICPRL